MPTRKAKPTARKPSGPAAIKPPKSTDPAVAHITPDLRRLAVPVSGLITDPENVRLHPDVNLKSITASLSLYGQRHAIVVNRRTGRVEAGNGRLVAARELGWNWIAAIFVDDDPTTASGFAIADNRTAELATWDLEGLTAQLDKLEEAGVAVEALGWTDEDRKLLTEGLEAAAGDGGAAPPGENGFDYEQKFGVIITVGTEAEQQAAFEKLQAEGWTCRVVTV